LDHAAIERAVDALAHAVDAGRIVFFCLGASGAVAPDAACKFFFLVTQCHAYADGHMQHMCAPTLGPNDVVVAISGTGKTRDLVRNARVARRSGATVVAITSPESPLAEVASVLVAADVREETDVYTPSVSRIVHLLVVDILAVGVALRFARRTEARVERIQRVVRASRLQGGETLAQDA
jgi:RpiR family transcriptional regulator, carbohydrate utilization regulator